MSSSKKPRGKGKRRKQPCEPYPVEVWPSEELAIVVLPWPPPNNDRFLIVRHRDDEFNYAALRYEESSIEDDEPDEVEIEVAALEPMAKNIDVRFMAKLHVPVVFTDLVHKRCKGLASSFNGAAMLAYVCLMYNRKKDPRGWPMRHSDWFDAIRIEERAARTVITALVKAGLVKATAGRARETRSNYYRPTRFVWMLYRNSGIGQQEEWARSQWFKNHMVPIPFTIHHGPVAYFQLQEEFRKLAAERKAKKGI